MKPTFQLNTSEFAATARRLREVKRISVEKLITDQSRLLTRDALRMTPPFGPNSITESFQVQRRIGQAAVRRDIARVFKPISSFSLVASPKNPKLAKAIQKAVRRKDVAGLQIILQRIGPQVKVLLQPDPALHASARGHRGRVRKGHQPALILDVRALKRYQAEKESHVGKTKAGWLPAAEALRVGGIPQWIKAHSGATAGLVRIERTRSGFFITVGNLVPYSGDFGPLRIIESVIGHRVRAMRIQAEKIVEAQLRKAAAT
jgi:hypothetical protein